MFADFAWPMRRTNIGKGPSFCHTTSDAQKIVFDANTPTQAKNVSTLALALM
jgi:hypothetical protein